MQLSKNHKVSKKSLITYSHYGREQTIEKDMVDRNDEGKAPWTYKQLKKFTDKFPKTFQWKIYLDMDDVIVDLNHEIFTYFNVNDHKELITKYSREDILFFFNEKDVDFWSNLMWKNDGLFLWRVLRNYDTNILTCTHNFPGAAAGKIKWLTHNVDPHSTIKSILLSEPEKEKYAGEHNILIDDYSVNCQKWIEAGGIAIQHKSSRDTIEQLKEIFKNWNVIFEEQKEDIKRRRKEINHRYYSKNSENWIEYNKKYK